MPGSDSIRSPLLRLFQRHRIADLEQLFAALSTHSRMTVFRRLSLVGYLSSYSHAGRYYTLRDIPDFDAAGLWQHAGVLFSRDGTLKKTVLRLAENSEAGLFQRELQLQLGLRVHNTLADLVAHKRLGREPVAGEYLYVSTKRARAAAQVAHRAELANPLMSASQDEALTPALVIAVLLEIIHGTVMRLDATEVAARLIARGMSVSVAQVQAVMRHHGVEKKTATSRSRRSRH